MRIVNRKKFIKMVIIILGVVFAFGIYFSNISFSKGEVKQKTIYVSSGDTLWSIAMNEKENNHYYEDKDVRDIIYEIRKANALDNYSYLKVGQKLIVNTL